MDTTNRILVTGCAGFMGSWICKELIKRGYSEIYGIDDLSGGSIFNIRDCVDNRDFTFINQDLSNTRKTKEIIEDIKPEVIFHLAANAREGASFFDPLNIVKRNYFAYINTLEPAIKTGKLDKIILFSSMAVYGNQKPPFSEDLEIRPEDVYGINKSAMEHTTELLSDVHNFKYIIIRPHNVIGEFQSMKDKYRNVVMIMANKILRNEPIYIYGDGRQKRAFSYIEDSLPCYIRSMDEDGDGEYDRINGEIINIGGSIPITINTLAELVTKYMGVSGYPVKYLRDRFGEVKDAWCTVDKSRKLLGYEEQIGYEEGIKRSVRWAKEQGKQEWTNEKLELWNDKAPGWWNE